MTGTATVGVGSSPDAGPGPAGSVLRAAVDVPDGGSSKAFVTRIVDIAAPASVDLSYVVLPAAKPMYAETGCHLALRNRKASTFTGSLLALSRQVNGALTFAVVREIDGEVQSNVEQLVGLEVTGPAHWYSVRVHVDVVGDAATVTVTVRDLVSGAETKTPFTNVPLVAGIDALQLDCGIYFANSGVGEFESAVDEVSLTACPR